jgi:hypothetical protein
VKTDSSAKQTLAWFVLLLMLSSCSEDYPSKIEAESACRQWEVKELSLNGVKAETANWVHLPAVNESNVITSRYCSDDQTLSQFLGFENKQIQNETWQDEQGKQGEWRVVKRFRYR